MSVKECLIIGWDSKLSENRSSIVIKKAFIVIFFVGSILSACGPGQMFGLAYTPTPTNTPVPTVTATPIPTNTLAATPTEPVTPTPTPNPGLGVTADEVVKTFTNLFTFGAIPDIDGNPAQKGVTEEGFSTITLVGTPYLVKAELKIDKSQENSFIATSYWILFLETVSHGGKEAADWVSSNFSKAMENGKVENTFGAAKVILKSNKSGSLFILTIVPKDGQ